MYDIVLKYSLKVCDENNMKFYLRQANEIFLFFIQDVYG